MFCGNCGSKLSDGAKFCASCGEPTGIGSRRAAYEGAGSELYTPEKSVAYAETAPKPAKRKGRFSNLLLLVVGVLILYLSVQTLMVGIYGVSTKPTNITFSREAKDADGGFHSYFWRLKYTYVVDGVEYTGTTTWRGSRDTPGGGYDSSGRYNDYVMKDSVTGEVIEGNTSRAGYNKYYVNYLPSKPNISRFEKYHSITGALNREEKIKSGAKTIILGVLKILLSLLLIILGLPKLGRNRRNKKTVRIDGYR